MDISKTEAKDFEGYIYEMPGSDGFAAVRIQVETEVHGHGCLFGIRFPPVSINGGCWRGTLEACKAEDFFTVFNQIMRDFHMPERISREG